MTSLSEGKYAGEFLLAEAPGTISRDTVTVTVPTATKFSPGTVLGQIAATGKYVAYDDGYSDGRETADGVLVTECDNTDGVAPVDFDAVIINYCAEVRSDDLTWVGGADSTGGAADLKSLGIKVR